MSEAGRRRAWQFGAVALFAAIVATVLILILNASTFVDLSRLPAQSKQVASEFGGIPQSGVELGEAKAPTTLVEFVDPQCPFCGQYSRDVLPTVLRRYVRTGRLRLRMELLTILGDDSQRMAGVAAAASAQDRAWQLMELFYENQGDEGSHYASDDYLRRIAEATPGLDAPAALRGADGSTAQALLDQASSAASRSGVDSTPTFFLEQRGEPPQKLEPSDLTPEAFTSAVNSALKG